jgi:sodium transport system permease protein
MTFPPDAPAPRTLRSEGGRLLRLTRKELNECLRDRRTIVTLVLMPILLYPLLAIAFKQVLLSQAGDNKRPVYRLGFVSEAEGRPFLAYLNEGEKALLRRYGRDSNDPEGRRGEEGEGPDGPPHRAPWPKFDSHLAGDLDAAVREGQVHVGIRALPRDPEDLPFAGPTYELIYREDSRLGRECVRYLETLTAEANAFRERLQLWRLRIVPNAVPLVTKAVPNPNPREASVLPSLIPLVLVLMTITGAVYPSIDLTAGERERGTLEVLVAAPIPRLGVLFGKYIAVLTVAMLTAVVNLTAMSITLYATGIGKTLFGTGMTPMVFVQVLALLLLFAAFFSGVLLAITSFARSFKEAQAYLIPLMLLALTPGILALLPGLSLDGPLSVVPLLNIVLLARDLFDGAAALAPSVIVILSTLLYAGAAVGLAARIFGTDAVLTSDQTGWTDVFRRPGRPRPVPTRASALFCLALLFPANFLLQGVVAQLPGLSLGEKLALLAVASLALFVGVPLIFTRLGNVRVASAFRLRMADGPVVVQASIAAVLLGVGLWPFTQELVLLLRRLGFTTLNEKILARLPEAIAEWRTYPASLIVLALAVTPAVTEELFFRGFLFGALLGRRDHEDALTPTPSPARAVLLTAVIFSLFHLLVEGAPAVERLPSSFLLGLLLGWMCWVSGSVWPGVVLHTLHNGLVVLLAYYEPWLTERGWIPAGEGHLPALLLVVCGLVAAVGLAWLLWLACRRATTASQT